MNHGTALPDPTEVLATHWNESERRLYPVATVNADAYASAVRIVRSVADALAEVATLDDLVTCWDDRSEIVAAALEAHATLPALGLGASEIAGAAFALRRRELFAERAEQQQRDRIAAARQADQAWAVIYEHGDLRAGLANPYQCVELHLATGLAVVSVVEPDPATMKPNYVVMVTAMGDEHASSAEVDPASFGDCETGDPQQFGELRRAMRSRVEATRA